MHCFNTYVIATWSSSICLYIYIIMVFFDIAVCNSVPYFWHNLCCGWQVDGFEQMPSILHKRACRRILPLTPSKVGVNQTPVCGFVLCNLCMPGVGDSDDHEKYVLI